MKHISSLFAIILSLLIPPNIQATSVQFSHTISNNLVTENIFTSERSNKLISYSENDVLNASDRTTLADTQYKPNQIDKSEESFVKYVSNSNEYDFELKNIATPQTCADTELSFLNEREVVAAGNVAEKLFYKNIDEFMVTIKGAASVDKKVFDTAYDLYKKGNWSEIETLFKKHNLNDFWPPANGGYDIIDDVPLKAGMKFDRYQFVDGGLDSKGFPILKGDYTSPIIDNNPFAYEARALNASRSENTLYYQIEVLKDIPGLKTQDATIIPWWGKKGKGKQNMWKFSSDPGAPQTWRDLINEGFIQVKIIDSPNGKYTKFIDKVIK